ncbi:MAG: RNA methyltransferase substrate-binding domain-containing protein, partial [Candidatus Manganitrophaceae bacterium]
MNRREKNPKDPRIPRIPRDLKPRDQRPSEAVEEAVIYGVHPIVEALRARKLNKVYLVPGRGGKEIDEIRILARQQRATVLTVSREVLDRMTKTGKHQG